jgi:hypothetical protein
MRHRALRRSAAWFAAVLVAGLAAVLAKPGAGRSQDTAAPPIGFVSKDRVVELATAADASIAFFVPDAAALASFQALVDPVHMRVFMCASRPADLKVAAAIGLAAAAAENPALTVEFIAVAEDLSQPQSLIAENAVTKAPEVIVYWLDGEIGRVRPEPGPAVEVELADLIFTARTQIAEANLLDNDFFKYTFHKDLVALDCKRCHGPGSYSRRPANGS